MEQMEPEAAMSADWEKINMTTAAARKPISKPSTKSFSTFLRTTEGRRWGSTMMYERLLAADIRSLPALLRWTRERYPEMYKNYHFMADCTGREAMQKLWAEYLEWSE